MDLWARWGHLATAQHITTPSYHHSRRIRDTVASSMKARNHREVLSAKILPVAVAMSTVLGTPRKVLSRRFPLECAKSSLHTMHVSPTNPDDPSHQHIMDVCVANIKVPAQLAVARTSVKLLI